MHVFSQNTVPVFLRRWSKNSVKYSISDIVKMLQIAAFLLRWLFRRCCKNIVNSNVLARVWGSEGEKTL